MIYLLHIRVLLLGSKRQYLGSQWVIHLDTWGFHHDSMTPFCRLLSNADTPSGNFSMPATGFPHRIPRYPVKTPYFKASLQQFPQMSSAIWTRHLEAPSAFNDRIIGLTQGKTGPRQPYNPPRFEIQRLIRVDIHHVPCVVLSLVSRCMSFLQPNQNILSRWRNAPFDLPVCGR